MTNETIVRNPDYSLAAIIWGRSGAWFYRLNSESHYESIARKFKTKHAAIVAYTKRRAS